MGTPIGSDRRDVLCVLLAGDETEIEVGNHALARQYRGASTSAAVGLGLGLNVLVGDGTVVVLQSVSIAGIVGAGATLGLGYLNLEPVS